MLASHRIPLYQIPVAVGLRTATNLLNRLNSENLNFNTLLYIHYDDIQDLRVFFTNMKD